MVKKTLNPDSATGYAARFVQTHLRYDLFDALPLLRHHAFMYPYLRLAKELFRHRKSPPLGIFETHSTTLICWPWDIDPWMELNNGRTLTMNDLSRVPMFGRMGAFRVMREKRWGATVAGVSVRYRRRVKVFDRIEARTRMIGWDARFIYLENTQWRRGECSSQVLLRAAITDKNGIVAPQMMAEEMGYDGLSPEMPEWVEAWIKADGMRPWPPQKI